jgi:hypothetical protein
VQQAVATLLRQTGDAPSGGAIQQTLSQHWTQEVARQEEHHVYMERFEEQEKLEPLLHSRGCTQRSNTLNAVA